MKRVTSAILALVMASSVLAICANAKGNGSSELTPEWKAMVLKNYEEFISEVDGNSNRIPLIISTDQHGSIGAGSELYKYINEITDWNKISKIINLGDTVEKQFNILQLLSYRIATRYLPAEKRIEVIGNHDRTKLHFGVFPSIFFPNKYAEKSNVLYNFTTRDDAYGIRYVAVDYKTDPWNYTSGRINKKQADFIVSELEKEDESDIILMAHTYIFRDAVINRDGTTFTGSDCFIGSEDEYADVRQSYIDMLRARKEKSSGVLLDCEGNEHPYDFSKCRGDLLLTLHGHHHTEGYETNSGITEFMFQSMRYDNGSNNEPNCFYFAYVDKENHTLKCWKNVEGYDAWEISF